MKNYFTDKELQCPCCKVAKMDTDFMQKLNNARALVTFPWHINSGYRCPKHNKELQSKSTNHTNGQAVDIRCANRTNRYFLVKALLIAGMRGIGIGPTFVHADTNREGSVLYLYKPGEVK